MLNKGSLKNLKIEDLWKECNKQSQEPIDFTLPPMGLKALQEWEKILKEFTKDCEHYGKSI